MNESDLATLRGLVGRTGGRWARCEGYQRPPPGATGPQYVPKTGVVWIGGRVEKLELPENGLRGALPETLEQLDRLRVLVLFGNALTAIAPRAWPRTLIHLDLSRNELDCDFPAGIANLYSLKRCHLEKNRLKGRLPALTLQHLEVLTAFQNNLQGELPLFDCPKLEQLWLHDNADLDGPLPDFSKCPNLKSLLLSFTNIHGDPTSVHHCDNVQLRPVVLSSGKEEEEKELKGGT